MRKIVTATDSGAGNALTKAFLAAFLLAFGAMWLKAAQGGALILYVALAVALLCATYWALGRCERAVQKHFVAIAAACALLLFALNVANGYALKFSPAFDLGAIYSGAEQWTRTGGFLGGLDCTCDPDYFYYFPNNIGGMAFLCLPLRLASLIGFRDTFAAAMIFNAILISLAAFVTALAGRRLAGTRAGGMALACFLLTPPVYFMAPAFYTDSLSMLFPVLVLYLYLRLRNAKSTFSRATLTLLIGLAAGVGMLIKFTVVIMLIAIVIGALLQKGAARSLAPLVLAAAMAMAVMLLFNQYIYANQLDKYKAEELNTPYLHWVMMSLEGEGGYNPEDYEFTRSFADPVERDAAIRERIAERVRAKGCAGMLAHLVKKGAADFGDGTLALSDFLDDGAQNETRLHEYLLYSGGRYGEYSMCCTGMFLSLQLMMLLCAALGLLRGLGRDGAIPLLSAFGLLLFLVFWEVSPRYVTNYLPVISICAAMGMDSMQLALRREQSTHDA